MLELFIGIGIVLSLVYYEITEISPGGLISPVYLALFMDQPKRIIGTILIAIVISYVLKFLGKYLPIYGKRRFVLAVLLGLFLKLPIGEGVFVSYIAIGNIIPGLIAIECDKQSVFKTISSLLIVTLLIRILLIGIQGRYFLW